MISTIIVISIYYKIKLKDSDNNNNVRIYNITNENKTEGNLEHFIITNFISYKNLINFSIFENIFYKIDNINYTYSKKYKKVKLEYMVSIYDEHKNIIYPSDFRLYKGFHVSCFLEIYNTNISIYSLAGIHENKHFKCIEYFNTNELVKFGIKIYSIYLNLHCYTIYCSKNVIFNYTNSLHENNRIFDPKYIINSSVSEKKHNKTSNLKQFYMLFPFVKLKRNVINETNVWYFKNIYNNYFCFCIGEKCLIRQPSRQCKYLFYMDIIEKNKNVYPKTDYLFVDFIFKDLSSDDPYPVFQQMIAKNLGNLEIYLNLKIIYGIMKKINLH